MSNLIRCTETVNPLKLIIGTDILYLLLLQEEPKYLYSYRFPLPGPFSARLNSNFQPLNLGLAKAQSLRQGRAQMQQAETLSSYE